MSLKKAAPTIEEIDAQIAALKLQRDQIEKTSHETKQKEALAKIASLKQTIENLFEEIGRIAEEAEIDYVSFDGPAYGMGGYWSESNGWESSSSTC